MCVPVSLAVACLCVQFKLSWHLLHYITLHCVWVLCCFAKFPPCFLSHVSVRVCLAVCLSVCLYVPPFVSSVYMCVKLPCHIIVFSLNVWMLLYIPCLLLHSFILYLSFFLSLLLCDIFVQMSGNTMLIVDGCLCFCFCSCCISLCLSRNKNPWNYEFSLMFV